MTDDLNDLLKGAAEIGALGNSEDGIAEAFIAEHGDAILFDHDRGRWRRWDYTVWREDATGAVMDDIRGACRRRAEGEKPGEQKRLRSQKTFAAVERIARNDQRVACTSERFDRDPMLLGTPGGTVDLRTGQVRDADPGDFITKNTAVTPAERADCQVFLRFLDEATGGDQELQRYLQRVSGYALTGDTSEHVILFIYGSGGNGKSVFVNTIAGVIGDYAQPAAMETFVATRNEQHSTYLAMLRSARLVTASETEEGRPWAESRIKQMTGGDRMTARFMHRDNFTFTPQFKAVIVGNHQPQLRNVDDAMRRRLHIIHFGHKPSQVDPQLPEKLREEWSAILRWMIDGALAWQRDGLHPPAAVQDATTSYFEAQDLLGEFIRDCCDTGPAEEAQAVELYRRWNDFLDLRGEPRWTNTRFGNAMAARGFAKRRKSKAKFYVGIAPRFDNRGHPVREEADM